jgi:UDP-N-acetylglucosamine 2-epimerase (non-hydrolysing)
VQGDTSSALGGTLAATAAGVPLAHVEAGLRSHDLALPWPEKGNRVAIDRLSHLLFAATEENAANLVEEQVGGEIHVTGNTAIDALFDVLAACRHGSEAVVFRGSSSPVTAARTGVRRSPPSVWR